MRCFIAIEIPNNIKSEIDSFIIKLKKSNSENNIKWVKENNMHLTLQFIGEIDDNRVEELKNSLKNIKFEPLTINIDNKLSFFPNKFNPKVIKISILDKKENLKRINSMIRQKLNSLGIDYDKKPFSAHLTLGRIKYLNSKFNSIKLPKFSALKIDKFHLFCSDLTSNGPIYTSLAEFNL
jgi:2'-5' RNA ligase